MEIQRAFRAIEILLVEDNPGDVRLTREALKGSKVLNHLNVVEDGVGVGYVRGAVLRTRGVPCARGAGRATILR